ncbi:hypothetical protein BDL97_18G050500 [Sphagnum fallax]|nr:hypothetical protein BDL97_18G050500 [Sphagnum fallax]
MPIYKINTKNHMLSPRLGHTFLLQEVDFTYDSFQFVP